MSSRDSTTDDGRQPRAKMSFVNSRNDVIGNNFRFSLLLLLDDGEHD